MRAGIAVGVSVGVRQGVNVDAGGGGPSAPTATVLTEGGSTTDGASVATASITPAADQVVFAAVLAFSAVSLQEPTASGNGLTWTVVAAVDLDANRKLTVFRAEGAAPSAGAITFDFGGVTQTSFVWSIVQYDVAGPQAQLKTATSVGNDITVTLDNPLDSASSRMLAFLASVSVAPSVDPSFTQLSSRLIGTNNIHLLAEHGTGVATCTGSGTAQARAAVGLEVAAA